MMAMRIRKGFISSNSKRKGRVGRVFKYCNQIYAEVHTKKLVS